MTMATAFFLFLFLQAGHHADGYVVKKPFSKAYTKCNAVGHLKEQSACPKYGD
jgi:hypothetical protein